MNEKTLKAIRGAACSADVKAEILQKTVDLYDKILAANDLKEDELVSVFFSVTQDITALNPATALRQSGRAEEAAMMVLGEARFQDSPGGVIRILVQAYMAAKKPVQHIYIHGAEKLRPDRAE